MAPRKKAKAKAKTTKKLQRRGRPAGGARKARSGEQRVRAQLQQKVNVRLTEVATLARGLNEQGLAPDEIAVRVRAELTGLGEHVTDDVLRLALNGIWVQSGGENA